jgi:hypothetical protein
MNEGDIYTLLDGLEDLRVDYVVARVMSKSDLAALRMAGISKAGYYLWSEEERQHLSDVVQTIKRKFAAKRIYEQLLLDLQNNPVQMENPEDPRSNCGYVYFIRQQDKIKIGYSKNVDARLRQLQTSSPVKLELVGYIEGDQETEKQLHELFDDYRLSGEWFSYSEEIQDHISGLDLIAGKEQE